MTSRAHRRVLRASHGLPLQRVVVEAKPRAAQAEGRLAFPFCQGKGVVAMKTRLNPEVPAFTENESRNFFESGGPPFGQAL